MDIPIELHCILRTRIGSDIPSLNNRLCSRRTSGNLSRSHPDQSIGGVEAHSGKWITCETYV
jgi:hypothetical protein